jgi:hypothetical protein
MSSEINISNAKIKTPTFCDLVNQKSGKAVNISSSPLGPLYNEQDEYNCTNNVITLKAVVNQMASSGFNGNNETNIGLSSSVELSFHDENGRQIDVTNSKSPIDLRIPRDGPSNLTFQFVNATQVNISSGSQLLPNSFSIKSNNASVHLQIKPLDLSIGYLVVLKFGYTPVLNSEKADYDFFKVLCPYSSDYVTLFNESFYLFFLNSSQVNGYKGFVGYGIRELTPSEINTYCIPSVNNTNKLNLKSAPLLATTNKINFTNDFYLLSYTSGCYYYDSASGKWTSYGMEVVFDTNIHETHCLSTHLTSFAGGLVVLPSAINFEYVWANASFLQNPIIYSTVIVVTLLYILFSVWAHLMDKKDLKKLNIVPLDDNLNNDNYFYEIIVFTGNRQEAGTDSKVRVVINGESGETETRLLNSPKNKSIKIPLFQRGSIDSFLMSVKG